MTSDKDCRQLITDRVQLYNIRKNEMFDAAALQAVWGIRPDQVVDFQALVGDPTDNIPGVPLIGPKIAQELLAKYGTLEAVLDHARRSLRRRSARRTCSTAARSRCKSRELARLKTDMPIVVDWDGGRRRPHSIAAVVADLCRECGFRQLARRIEALAIKLSGPRQRAAAR